MSEMESSQNQFQSLFHIKKREDFDFGEFMFLKRNRHDEENPTESSSMETESSSQEEISYEKPQKEDFYCTEWHCKDHKLIKSCWKDGNMYVLRIRNK
ncbi:hypothetical protein [Neobacillus thermocopriae]|uniref:hypothetical protein n=1 Tax=Neobacillus thermocopriae TaxID=1215031 RepID=UPI00376FC30A